jgi:hypothetical protein
MVLRNEPILPSARLVVQFGKVPSSGSWRRRKTGGNDCGGNDGAETNDNDRPNVDAACAENGARRNRVQ